MISIRRERLAAFAMNMKETHLLLDVVERIGGVHGETDQDDM